ncbi:hypothetical protein [Lysobacter gummosus]|uniref:hypothetical protein n=1 Tax=Lysobacter gummosus TaxID=262324 RepID=UPI0036293499
MGRGRSGRRRRPVQGRRLNHPSRAPRGPRYRNGSASAGPFSFARPSRRAAARAVVGAASAPMPLAQVARNLTQLGAKSIGAKAPSHKRPPSHKRSPGTLPSDFQRPPAVYLKRNPRFRRTRIPSAHPGAALARLNRTAPNCASRDGVLAPT